MIAKIVTNIISRNRGKCGKANSPVLAVPAVSSVDKQAIEVTWKDNNKIHFEADFYYNESRSMKCP